jgi:hypothetical protein
VRIARLEDQMSRDAYGMPRGEFNLPPGVTGRMIDEAAGDGGPCDCDENSAQQKHVHCDYDDKDEQCCRQDESGKWICETCWPMLHPHSQWGDESDPIHGEGCAECDKIEEANAEFQAKAEAILAERKADE